MDGTTAALLTTAELASLDDFRLGLAQVSPSRRSIDGPGGTALVEPRVMQVLTALAEARGNVVTREYLFRRCWGNPFVGDDSLNRAIAGARRLASSVADNSFTIENIPRTGYRLVETTAAADGPVPEQSPEVPRLHTRRAIATGGIAAAAGAAGLAFWSTRTPPYDPATRLIDQSRASVRLGTATSQHEAVLLLKRAVAISPNNAEAWGLLALSQALADEHSGPNDGVSPAAEVDKAAGRALALDRNNADAEAALAIVIPYYGDWLAAERRFDAVLAQHPHHVVTQDSRLFLLGAVGRMRESARDRLKLSNDASFDANMQYRHIYALWFLDRIEEGDRVASRAMEMWPRHSGIWFAKLWLLTGTRRFDRALAHIDDELARPRLPPPMVLTLRSAIRAAGNRIGGEIEAANVLVMAGVRQNVAAVVTGMMLLNLMGSIDQAFDLARAYYLEKGPIIAALEWRPGQFFINDQRRRKTNMLFTPTAATMQQDSRFLPMMREMGLVDYWNRRGILPDFLAGGGS